MAQKRGGRRRTGTLVTNQYGTYYLRVVVDGKVLKRSLSTKSRREAEAKREQTLQELGILARERVDILSHVRDSLETAEAKWQQAERERTEAQEQREREQQQLRVVVAWDAFLEAANRPDTGAATLQQYSYQWKAFTKWLGKSHPGAFRLAHVSVTIGEGYSQHLRSRNLAAGTFNKHVALCRLVFRTLADREGRRFEGISRDPFEGVQHRSERQQHRRELSFDVLGRICDAAEGETKLLLFLGIYTGMRLKDCCLLRWGEVDLARGMIIHVPFKTARRHDEPLHIPIHPSLRNMLESVPEGTRQGPVLPRTAETYSRRRNTITSRLQRLFTTCGVQVHRPGTGGESGKPAVLQYGFHSLRHTAVTLLQEAGAPAAIVQALVGHQSRAMTEKYTHVSPKALTAAVAHMPSLAERARQETKGQAPHLLPAGGSNTPCNPLRLEAQALLAAVPDARMGAVVEFLRHATGTPSVP